MPLRDPWLTESDLRTNPLESERRHLQYLLQRIKDYDNEDYRVMEYKIIDIISYIDQLDNPRSRLNPMLVKNLAYEMIRAATNIVRSEEAYQERLQLDGTFLVKRY